MARNLVICLDGTGNQFGDANSNVIKLYQMLDHSAPERQVAYYHPGLGTIGAPNALSRLAQWWTRMLGLAIGYGVIRNLEDAYAFLMSHHAPGDRVFLFGFSRGAYTARALASMLHMFGLLRDGHEVLLPYAARMLKAPQKKTWAIAKAFKSTFSRDCPVHFVGVWDTVSSVGWAHDPLKLPYTAHNPEIHSGRHALAIDERRCSFRQNLWQPEPSQDIKQVWFAGVHSDVGGSYPEPESGLAKNALAWMAAEARSAGVLIDATQHDRILGKADGLTPPDPDGPMHNSLHGVWLILEIFPHRYWDTRRTPPGYSWKVPLGRRRYIAEHSVLHDTVLTRMRDLGYRPANLPVQYTIEPVSQ